jgi:hypothetical protein
MFDSLMGIASGNAGLLLGGGSAGICLWVLKKVPNDQIASIVETFFFGCIRGFIKGLRVD